MEENQCKVALMGGSTPTSLWAGEQKKATAAIAKVKDREAQPADTLRIEEGEVGEKVERIEKYDMRDLKHV